MINSRNSDSDDNVTTFSGQDDDRVAISDRRARRKAKRSGTADNSDDTDYANEDDESGPSVTAPKETRTRSQREALQARERSAVGFGQNLPVIGGVFRYFSAVTAEIRKVTWPTREESQRLTTIVLMVTIAFSLFLGSLDLFYGEWVKAGIKDTGTFVLIGVPTIVIAFAFSWVFIIREE